MRRLWVLATAVATTAGYQQNFLSEEEIIRHVNTNGGTWAAAPSTRFANTSMTELVAMMGLAVESDAPLVGAELGDYEDVLGSLPASFDGREKWGACVHPVLNQMQCGSCWAFGATETLSDRFCMAGKNVVLSPQNMVSCDHGDGGCDGGTLAKAWHFLSSRGVVTADCQPYTSGDGVTGHCQKHCANGKPRVVYKARTAYSVVSLFDDRPTRVRKIKAEVYKNGPVEVGYTVFQDFMSYQGGVYQHVVGGPVGGHAVKIVGWGDAQGVPYWIIANSWGADWGERGFFRFAIGQNHYEMESNVYAGLPDLTTGWAGW